jgi:hypothetical protein
MRIFLCYESNERSRAEEIALALEAQGHDVFLDATDLAPGDDYNSIIRERIARADLFIFLITPRSVAPGAYTLTELKMAREKWPHPKGGVLPVMLAPTDMPAVPAYLRGVTILEPEGSVAAEVAARVAAHRPRIAPGRLAAAALVVVALGGALAAFALLDDRDGASGNAPPAPPPARTWPVSENDFIARHVYPPDVVERTGYTTDPTHSIRGFQRDFISVARVAFGTIADTATVVSVHVVLANSTANAFPLDLTERFFELRDDQGREGELLYFCCTSRGEMLGAGEERLVKLIFAAHGGWIGKETGARLLYFKVSGLLPVVGATWSIPVLAAAR